MNPTRVLIVDDEAGFTRLIKLALEKTGAYLVREENNPRRALEAAREFNPAIIFLDVVMPAVDGGDVAQRIREDAELAQVPIVFLTAIATPDESNHPISGFRFLAKPVTVEALIRCIHEHAFLSAA